jgi:hypothetical protein
MPLQLSTIAFVTEELAVANNGGRRTYHSYLQPDPEVWLGCELHLYRSTGTTSLVCGNVIAMHGKVIWDGSSSKLTVRFIYIL